MLDRLRLGNDNEDNIEPSDSVAHLDNFDSDDDTYDPNHEDIPNTCNTTFVLVCVFFIYFESISNIYINKSCSFFVIVGDGEQPSTM